MRQCLVILLALPLLCWARPSVEQQRLFQEAELLYQDQRFEEALGVWERMLDSELERAERRVVRFNLARTLMELERWDAAIPLLEGVAADREAGAELLRLVYTQIASAAIEQADTLCPRDIDFENPDFPADCIEALSWLEAARQASQQAVQMHSQAALVAGRDASAEPRDLTQQQRAEQLRTAWILAAQEEHRRRHAPYAELIDGLAQRLMRAHQELGSGARLDSVAYRGRNNAAEWVALRERAPDDSLSQDLLYEILNSYQRSLEYIDREERLGAQRQMARAAYGLHAYARAQKGEDVLGGFLSARERLLNQGRDPQPLEQLYQWLVNLRPDEEALRQAILQHISERLEQRADARMHRLLFELIDVEETQTLLSLLQQQDGDLLRALTQKFGVRADFETSDRARLAQQYLQEGQIKQALQAWDLAAYLRYELETLQRQQAAFASGSPLKQAELTQHKEQIRSLKELIELLEGLPAQRELSAQLQEAITRNSQAQDAVQEQLVRHYPIYLRDATQWLKRAQQLLQTGEESSPADVLRWAIAEQDHALDLNAWTQELAPDEIPLRELLELLPESQDISIKASLPFLPSVRAQFPEQDLEALSQQEPWSQVLPLFEEGSQAARAARKFLAPGSLSLAEALSEQVRARERWEEALKLLEPPDDSQDPNEDDQEQDQNQDEQNDDEQDQENQDEQDQNEQNGGEQEDPTPQEQPSSAQEILELLQRMEEEDQHQAPEQGRVREGLKPW